MGDEQVLAGPSGTKATPHRILRWKTGNGRDRIHHPRYRDFATIPAADFLQ
jgi:hypothetical protein